MSSGPVGTGFLSLFGGSLITDGGNDTLSNQVGLNGSVILAGGGLAFGPPTGGLVMFVGGNSTLTVNNTTTISEQISAGAFGLTLGSGSTGTLYLTNNGNSLNGMTLAGGTLEIGASSFVSGGSLQSGPVGEGSLTLSAGTLASDGGNYTLSNPTSLSGSLILTGGSLTFDPQGDGASMALTGNTTLTVNNLTTIKDVIANNFILTLAAASTGTLYLSNPGSTFHAFAQGGGTLEIGASSTVNAGVLGNGPLGNGNVTISGGSFVTDGGNYTLANKFNLSGNLTLAGGQLTLDAQGDGAIVTLQGNTALTVNNTTIIDELIGGSAGLTLASGSTGILKLEAANAFTGGVNLNGGTLFVGNDAALGTGTLTFGGGVLEADGGPRTIANPVTIASGPAVIDGPQNLTLTSFVNGTGGGLTKNGAGTLTLAAGGSLNGPLNVNQGSLIVGGNLTAVGATNYGNLSLGGITMTVGGSGLDNEGLLSLSGSTLAGAGAIVNNNTLSGFGTIGGSGGFTNDAFLTVAGGNLTLTNSGTNLNVGAIGLASGEFLQLGADVSLTNSGTLSLNGGLVSGTGTLVNSGGSITGPGVISAGFNNANGVVVVGNANNLTIVRAWINGGIVQLTSLTSNLTGGAVTNNGTIQGLGAVSAAVGNNGSIEASGGTLSLAGSTTNSGAGTLNVDAGSKLIVTTGLATNAGTIVNQGGTFDNNGFPLNNTGVVAGFGVFRTGGSGLTNNGGISLTGGATTVIGPVTNQSGRTITVAYNPALFTGLVTNNGSATFNILNATATFAGGFSNSGNSSFSKAGSGEVDITAAPTLDDNSVLSVAAGRMKFNIVSGTPLVGAGVTAAVASGATLELSGTVSALSSGPNRANITNNSSAPGVVVSGTNQQFGNIDGSGTTQVNAGSDLTADHIVQSALVIGGQSGSPGTVTIAASDSLGQPIVQDQGQPVELASGSSSVLAGPIQADLAVRAPINSQDDSAAEGDPTHSGALTGTGEISLSSTVVPEPSTLVLVMLGIIVASLRKARVPGRLLAGWVALASEA